MADANFALLDKRGKKYVIVAGRKFSSIGVIWTLEQKGIFKTKSKWPFSIWTVLFESSRCLTLPNGPLMKSQILANLGGLLETQGQIVFIGHFCGS